ncbi:unnamed protein product [Bursaphelenchus xylophilus]|uniref:Dipeptidyl peptidase 3 n=1 Tax=Bursaphelenchus xylophilus TaxID=6326 RepID=A0A1I7SCL0_BURXY|nr:unnamed protein product [Bursaphelenchus xylophilus]CAG9093916.1 unnamed protein product [Bursaphelenchus xylophilus]
MLSYVIRRIGAKQCPLSRIRRSTSTSLVRHSNPLLATNTMASPAPFDRTLHVVRSDTPILKLECEKAFSQLSNRDKLYAHYLARASFDGGLITFCQRSPESPAILYIFTAVFRGEALQSLREKALEVGWSEDDFNDFLYYFATFYYNAGNYFGFGDRKMVPAVSQRSLRQFLFKTAAFNEDTKLVELYNEVEEKIYGLSEKERFLGYPNKSTTGFHSKNITEEDTKFITKFFTSINFEGWNTRLEKKENDGETTYFVRVAAVNNAVLSSHEFEGRKIIFQAGDYSQILARVIPSLEKAREYANDNQKEMLAKYVEHFKTGSLAAHKDGSRFWIKDVNPAVESYIGFIENYSDPDGVRSEYEGFVAVVDKEVSAKFQKLVANAGEYIQRLPWGAEYEKDKFLKPDFTSLNVLAFASSGVPAGINIPNYDEIRQSEGFKNVSLGNVISAVAPTRAEFLSEEDDNLYRLYFQDSFEVQVGLHELLGHGSGKLFMKSKGELNFDPKTTKDLLNGGEVTHWYEEGETWSSKFGQVGASYEECRAEAVGYYLCCYDDIMNLFGYEGDLAETVRYVNWVNEIRAGLMGLENYDPDQNKWIQAHSRARFVLFRVVLEAGQGFVSIEETTDAKGVPDLLFKLDRTKIQKVGRPAVGEFLKKLQYYKSTGNNAEGIPFYDKWSEVDEKYQRWRKVVLARRKPRKVLVQHNTVKEEDTGDISIVNYEPTPEGVVLSVLERHPESALEELLEVYEQEKKTIFA